MDLKVFYWKAIQVGLSKVRGLLPIVIDNSIRRDGDSDSDGEEVDDLFGAKELPDGTSVYYVSPEARNLFSAHMEETAYDAIVEFVFCSDGGDGM